VPHDLQNLVAPASAPHLGQNIVTSYKKRSVMLLIQSCGDKAINDPESRLLIIDIRLFGL
jgi:hypothetical protein